MQLCCLYGSNKRINHGQTEGKVLMKNIIRETDIFNKDRAICHLFIFDRNKESFPLEFFFVKTFPNEYLTNYLLIN